MRCLIVKTSALGDIVQTYPVLLYLRKHYPTAHLTWVVERPYVDLVTANPAVDTCLTINTKAWRQHPFSRDTWKAIGDCRHALRHENYDLVLDLQGNVKSAFIVSQARSSHKVGFAAPYVSERPNCWVMHQHITPPPGRNIREDYLFLAHRATGQPLSASNDLPATYLKVSAEQQATNCALVPDASKTTALLFAGSAWPNKQLTETTLTTFALLAAERLHVHWLLAWGTAAELSVAERLQRQVPHARCIERLPMPQLQHLMSRVDLVVSMDSFPLHLAATTTVPTYSCFGPSLAAKYAPVGPQHMTYQGICPYQQTFTRRCPKLRTCATGSCLRDISPYTLYEHFSHWWQQQVGHCLTHSALINENK